MRIKYYSWLPDKPVKDYVSNMVYTASLNIRLDLKYLCKKLRSKGISYNPKKFAACIFRFKSLKCVVLLFKDGELVCTGAKSIHQARHTLWYIISFLETAKYEVQMPILRIQNLVVAVTLPYCVRHRKYAHSHTDMASYRGRTFPGVIIRHKSLTPVTALLFQSGQMVLTGLKDKSDVDRALDILGPSIVPYFITTEDKKEAMTQMNAYKPTRGRSSMSLDDLLKI